MKTKSIALFAFASATVMITASAPLLSQDQVPPPPVAPEPPIPPADAAPRRLTADVKPLLDDVRRQVDAAREQAEVAFGAAGDVFSSFVGGDGNFLFRPGGRAARSLVIAIEPMVTLGHYGVKVLKDGWTVITEDGSLAAHFEHTVAVTEDGPQVLTDPEEN